MTFHASILPFAPGFRRSALCVVLAAGFATVAGAQAAAGSTKWVDSARALIEAGMSVGTPQALDPALALLDRVLTVIPDDGILLHYKGYALYRKATLLRGRDKDGDVRPLLDEASRALEESAKRLEWPETFALRSSVFGQMISASPNPINAMRLGPKSDQAMARAVALGPNNPRVFLLRGIGNMYKPGVFGGGLDKAERDLKKAIALFASDKPEPPAPAWGFAETFAFLGQVYAKQERADSARAAYNKALEIDPDFGWVKYVLIPDLDRKKR